MLSGYSIIQLPEMVIALYGFIKNWMHARISMHLSHKDGEMNKIQDVRMNPNSIEDSTMNCNVIHPIQIQRIEEEQIRESNKCYDSILKRLDKLESKIE